MISFLETWQTRNGFAKGRFFYLAEKKKQTWQPLTTQIEEAM